MQCRVLLGLLLGLVLGPWIAAEIYRSQLSEEQLNELARCVAGELARSET